MSSRLQLDRDYLIQMITAPDFFIDVPEFLYLKEIAAASKRAAAAAEGCQACGSEWKHMRGVCDAVFLKLKELVETQRTEVLLRVKVWLSKRKGCTVSVCVLYYRRSREQGPIAKLQF